MTINYVEIRRLFIIFVVVNIFVLAVSMVLPFVNLTGSIGVISAAALILGIVSLFLFWKLLNLLLDLHMKVSYLFDRESERRAD